MTFSCHIHGMHDSENRSIPPSAFTIMRRSSHSIIASTALASLAMAALTACSGLTLPPTEAAQAPAAIPAPTACCASFAQLPDTGTMRNQRVVALNRESAWFVLDGQLTPVSVWQLPLPRGEASMDLLALTPPLAEPGLPLKVGIPKLVFLDAFGNVLPSRLQGPRAEQSAEPQLRWTVDVPASAERVVIGLDLAREGERLGLSITEPGVSQVISGIRVDGAPVVTPVAVRVGSEGRFRVFFPV